MNAHQRQHLAKYCRKVQWDVPMDRYSTFRTGGRATALVQVEEKNELAWLLGWLTQEEIHWQVLGGGSNILVASNPFSGVFVQLAGTFASIKLIEGAREKRRVEVGAGCSLGKLATFCRRECLTGLEWAVGIPGTVGGAIKMNAGAHGGQIADSLFAVTVFNQAGEEQYLRASDIDFAYRTTTFPTGTRYIVTCSVFDLPAGDGNGIEQKCREYAGWRKQHQPINKGSAGSFFKNPPGDAAGRLIEAAGLKGLQVGGALVSEQHANFIVNTGTATPQDIVALQELVQQKVEEQFGILLEPEVHIY